MSATAETFQQELVILRGIPASGKSTFATAWVDEDPKNRARVNRDEIRQQLFNRDFDVDERLVTRIEHAMITASLDAGKSVVVDATHIRHAYIREVAKLAPPSVAVSVREFDIDIDEALRRNAMRSRRVPEDVVRQMHQRLRSSGPYTHEPTEAIAPYVRPVGKPKAVLFDVDGTLAIKCDRSPYDWSRVGEDTVNEAVADAFRTYGARGDVTRIVMSGRDSCCRDATQRWQAQHDLVGDMLLMRGAGDQRRDSVVKLELFDQHIRSEYDVICVYDDRDQVVEMWRRLGLPCFQVAPGNF